MFKEDESIQKERINKSAFNSDNKKFEKELDATEEAIKHRPLKFLRESLNTNEVLSKL